MKKTNENMEKEIAITDILLRLTTLEHLLISKGVITPDEFYKSMDQLSRKIAKNLLESAKVSGNLDEIIDSLGKKSQGN